MFYAAISWTFDLFASQTLWAKMVSNCLNQNVGWDASVIKYRDRRIIPKENMRELSITAFSNHDFPTLTGFWNGEDFKWCEKL